MPRVDRLDLLLRIVRDRPGVTATTLAEDLGVSVRSIFRDIRHLRERGYPLEADRGRGGGVRLHARWGLSKVMLSLEEALVTLLSLAIGEKLGLPMFAQELAQARKRIVDAFPAHERRRIAPLRERILVGGSASTAVRASYGEPDGRVMRTLQVAFVRERVVRADYVKENGERVSRRLEPHALLINWPAWYVLGFDLLRAQPRTFRFDRFESVEEETQIFRPRPRALAAAILGEEIRASTASGRL